MAGIGFELKKLFRSQSVLNTMRGIFYASLTTIGPLILIVVALFTIYVIFDYSAVSFILRDLVTSTILYVFIFSLITTSPVNSVLSRYIADKIYEDKFDDILPSYYVGLFINTIISTVIGIPFVLHEYFVGKVNPFFVLISYCMYISLVFVFYNMTYISALKEYKKITYSFVIGLTVTIIFTFILVRFMGQGLNNAIIYAFTLGFVIIGFLLFSLVRSFFRENSHNYKETLYYFKKHRILFSVNLFYTLGLYSHNFVFWTVKELQLIVVHSFVSAPVYDMATCIAMFINISTMVIFVVQVETAFHDQYVNYCQAIIGGTSKDIAKAKTLMLKTLKEKVLFIFQLQLLINVILYLLSLLLLPRVGISGIVLDILPSLAVAYFAIFIMFTLIVFMYYFEDGKGALYTAIVFFGISTIGSIFSKDLIPSLYGLGLFIGAMSGLLFAYMRLRYIERNLERHIFCRGMIIEKEFTK